MAISSGKRMSKESFQNLKEVQSLLKSEKELFDKIEAERKRMTQLESQRNQQQKKLDENLEALSHLKKEAVALENELAAKQDQLNQAKKALDGSNSEQQVNAAQKQKETLEEVINSLQEKGFSFLEQEEVLDASISECHTFLEGVKSTIVEVSQEVENEISLLQEKLKINQTRIDNLLEISEKNIVFMFQEACKKHKYHSPLTTIDQRSCRICKYMPEGILLTTIERGEEAFLCDGCQRLFSPL